jgi:hypothetical protein
MADVCMTEPTEEKFFSTLAAAKQKMTNSDWS